MPLKDQEAYNQYMKEYQRKRRLQIQAMQMLVEWIIRAKAGNKATLLLYENDYVVALVPKQNILPFLTSATKIGIPAMKFAKTFTITCEVSK